MIVEGGRMISFVFIERESQRRDGWKKRGGGERKQRIDFAWKGKRFQL